MLMRVIITTLLVSLAAPLLEAAPRIVVSLTKGAAGKVAVRIENVGPQPIALSATTYVAMLKWESPERHTPLYWAKLEAHGVPTSLQALSLIGLGSSTVEVDPCSLTWSRDRTGLSPEQPLRRVVPPGDYELQLQIVDDQEHWWRSGELLVFVSANGQLRF
jgi:hypothetical protein